MGLSHLITLLFFLFCCQTSFAAKIYKCKDANGRTVFSNFACDGNDTEKGVVGTNHIGANNEQSVYRIKDGLTPAERQLKNLQDQKKEKLLLREMRRESARKRAQHEREMQAEQDRQKRAAQVNKANCNYYKARADYYEHDSRQRDDSKSDNLADKSRQRSYERRMANEC